MSVTYNPKTVIDGLVLYLDAANKKSYPGTGTSWNDLSTIGVNGTLINSPAYVSSDLGSFLFDNTNDLVTVNHNSNHLSNSGTMIFWAKPLSDGTSNVCRFANKANDTVGTAGYNFAINTDRLLMRINAGLLTGTVNMVNYYGKWSQYAFTWTSTGNTGVIYINDTVDISGSLGATVSMTTTNPLYIGNLSDFSRTFDGNISIVQYYNRQLSFQEIQNNFNALRGRYNV